MEQRITGPILGLLRISLGWILLWAFIDKVFGLGFSTKPDAAWVRGISPTTGFLRFGIDGTFAPVFKSFAGSTVIDWLFMLGLLCIGSALILGIGMRIASVTGTVLMILLYLAVFPSEHNPLVDEHVIYALLFVLLGTANAGEYFGFGKTWSALPIVRTYPWLR